MRKIGLWILFLIFSVKAFSADFTFTHLSEGMPGNNHYPGIGENDQGERLAIWRSGNNRGMLFTYFKDGNWSRPAPIRNQPKTSGEYLGSDIVVDSENRFHVVWELMDDLVFYATFMDGVWTDPVKVPFPARYEGFQLSLDIRSDDELVMIACCKYARIYKDITIGYLEKGETNFSRFENLTDDEESSSSPAVAIDEDDHIWIAYKGEVFGQAEEILETCLIHLDQDNALVDFTRVSEEQGGWAFLQWVACNDNTGLVMTTWWWHGGFYSRWYNQSTETWSPITRIGVNSIRHPDFSMWSKVVAQGDDFYFLAKNSSHHLYIVKFNGETEAWETPILVYDEPTVYFDIYPGYEDLLIAFCTREEPTQVYFTAMGPSGPVPPDNEPPMAEFEFTPTTAIFPAEITFNASSSRDPDGDIVSYSWDFGDGGRAGGVLVSHTYDRGGTFVVRLVVRDNAGATGVRTHNIEILWLFQPLNIRWETKIDESLLQSRRVTLVTWSQNPANDALGVQIVLYRVYRKKPGQSDAAYLLCGEVTAGVYKFLDTDIGRDDVYVYTVTARDSQGHESPIVDEQAPSVALEKRRGSPATIKRGAPADSH
jgi:PKD repeat protein